ncbi:PQQ-binding-like beta-propeller repeat protein [Phenylobacterium sp.]|uniref:outer membrane protein assembly factor BamB family protein n=1 Tax=Phenylobacterium sp. TaxID=1871053 RepID=UPI0030F391E1
MTLRSRTGLALLLTAALAASGCSTISRLNPFPKKEAPGEVASEGERIAIIAFDKKVEADEGLKGIDFFLPDPVTASEWTTPGGTLDNSVGHVAGGGNLSIAWKRGFGQKSGRGAHITAPPVAANGKIYVMDGEATVSAHDAQTGAEVWKVDLRPDSKRDKEAFGGGVAIADGKLYVASGYRFVAQLNADTGAVGWKVATEQPIHAAPTVAGGRLFVVAVDNTLLSYNTADGTASWTYQALSESSRILGASTPAVSGDTVVAAFGSGELVALRAANGNDLWNEALSRASRNNALSEIRDIPGRPVIFQGDVFAVSHSGVFAATDLRTGQARWTLPITGVTTPWPSGDVVYVVDKSGQVICVARESGLIYWIRDLGEGRGKAKGGLMGIGLGRKKYVSKPMWSSPILASGKLITASNQGELVALNAKTGVVEKTMNLGSGVLLGPISINNTIYIATDEAQLIALR